jgi:DNA topoisomerase I
MPTARESRTRTWCDVRSDDVNSYIQEKIGEDFRTWHGTVLAAVELAGEREPGSEAAAKRAISAEDGAGDTDRRS